MRFYRKKIAKFGTSEALPESKFVEKIVNLPMCNCDRQIFVEENFDPSQEDTLGQKPTFYPKITKNLIIETCEFCEK